MTGIITLNKEKLMKCYLNSLYGSLVYADTDSIKVKEKEMKNYIVIHDKDADGIVKVGIIFTSKIAGIIKGNDGKAIILLDSAYHQYCIDDYEDIVKQLL